MGLSSESVTRLIRFGTYELDAESWELRNKGAKVKIEGQPLRVLAILLERAGELVPREELKQKLWPEDTFVDFDHSINAAVKRLREALNDSATTPRFIETLPRRGYRFICPLDNQPAPVPARRRRWALALIPAAVVGLGGLLLSLNVVGIRAWWLGHSAPAIRSMVVFPLENQTGDTTKEYLARGFADDLTHEIGGVGAWDMAPLDSAIELQRSGKAPIEVARELGADALVTGTLQQTGDRFRVNLKLVYSSGDRRLVLASYYPTAPEMANLPRRAALDILQQANVTVPPAAQARLERKRQVNPQAFIAYSIGRNAYATKITEEGHLKGIEKFEQAVAADPNYAEAYSAMARSFVFMHQLHPGAGFAEKAKSAALKALKLDPELAEPHALLANLKRQEGDRQGAEEEYQLALRLNSSDADVHHSYSVFLHDADRKEEALRESLRAEQLDPRSAFYAAAVAMRFSVLGRYEDAVTQSRKAQQLDPNLWIAHSFGTGALWHLGRRDEAIAELEKALLLEGVTERGPLSNLVVYYAEMGRNADAQKAFERLRQLPDVEPQRLAAGYAALGNKKEAIHTLQAGRGRVNLQSGPMAESLRDLLGNEPEYQALLRNQKYQALLRNQKAASQRGSSNPPAEPRN